MAALGQALLNALLCAAYDWRGAWASASFSVLHFAICKLSLMDACRQGQEKKCICENLIAYNLMQINVQPMYLFGKLEMIEYWEPHGKK